MSYLEGVTGYLNWGRRALFFSSERVRTTKLVFYVFLLKKKKKKVKRLSEEKWNGIEIRCKANRWVGSKVR